MSSGAPSGTELSIDEANEVTLESSLVIDSGAFSGSFEALCDTRFERVILSQIGDSEARILDPRLCFAVPEMPASDALMYRVTSAGMAASMARLVLCE